MRKRDSHLTLIMEIKTLNAVNTIILDNQRIRTKRSISLPVIMTNQSLLLYESIELQHNSEFGIADIVHKLQLLERYQLGRTMSI